MIPFTKYADIKDRYCICYFGPNDEYLFLLKILKPIIEKKFQNLKITIGCKDDKVNFFEIKDDFLKMSDLRSKRFDFGYIRELKFNGTEHPIEALIKECQINECAVATALQEDYNNKCVIITQGNYPTLSLDKRKLNILEKIAKEEGFDPVIDENVKGAGFVMGVESYGLFEAASRGVRTLLWPTGLGTNLYKLMFPKGEIISI